MVTKPQGGCLEPHMKASTGSQSLKRLWGGREEGRDYREGGKERGREGGRKYKGKVRQPQERASYAWGNRQDFNPTSPPTHSIRSSSTQLSGRPPTKSRTFSS